MPRVTRRGTAAAGEVTQTSRSSAAATPACGPPTCSPSVRPACASCCWSRTSAAAGRAAATADSSMAGGSTCPSSSSLRARAGPRNGPRSGRGGRRHRRVVRPARGRRLVRKRATCASTPFRPRSATGTAGVAELRELGVGDELRSMDAAEIQRVCASPAFRDGLWMRSAASIQPARLARGLRRVLLERGVRIHEETRVRSLSAGSGHLQLVTDAVASSPTRSCWQSTHGRAAGRAFAAVCWRGAATWS